MISYLSLVLYHFGLHFSTNVNHELDLNVLKVTLEFFFFFPLVLFLRDFYILKAMPRSIDHF